MNPRDIATLNLKSSGGQQVAADIAKIKNEITDLKIENDKLAVTIRTTKGEISKVKQEISGYDAEISKLNKTIDKAVEKDRLLQAKMEDLANAGKSGGAEWNNYNRKVEENIVVLEKAKNQLQQVNQSKTEAKQRLNALKNSEAEYKAQVDKNKNSLSELAEAQEKATKKLKISELTYNQLSARARELRKELNNTSKELNPKEWNKLNNELRQVETQMQRVSVGGQQVKSKFEDLGKTVSKVLVLMAAYAAIRFFQDLIRSAKEWVVESVNVARGAEGVRRAFERIAEPGLLDKLREQTRGLIGDFELMQAAVKADKYRIPITEVGNLLEFASRRAIDMGQNVDDFQKRIINGIGKESKLILDDLGLSSVEINKAIAKEGNFAKGVIAIVNKELEKQGELALTGADIATQATVEWKNAQGDLGDQILWIDKIWSKFSLSVAQSLREWISSDLPGLIQKMTDLYNWFADFYNTSNALQGVIKTITLNFKLFYDVIVFVFDYAINQAKTFGNLLRATFTLDWKLFKQTIKDNFESGSAAAKKLFDNVKKDFEDFFKKPTKINPITVPVKTSYENTGGSDPLKKELTEEELNKLRAKQKKEFDRFFEDLETAHQKRLFEIKQQYADGRITSESEYNQRIYAQEQSYMLLREQLLDQFLTKTTDKEIRSDINNKIAEIQNKRLDQEIKFRDRLNQILLDANPAEKEKQEYENRLRDLQLFGESAQSLKMKLTDAVIAGDKAEKQRIQDQLQALELLQKQHYDNLDKIRRNQEALDKKAAEEEFDNNFRDKREQMRREAEALEQQVTLGVDSGALTGRSAFDAEVALQKQKIDNIKAEIAERERLKLNTERQYKQMADLEVGLSNMYATEFRRRGEQAAQYGEAVGAVLGNAIIGQGKMLENFAEGMIDLVFDTLAQMINAEIIRTTMASSGAIGRITVEALSQPDAVATFGATALPRIAILTALVTGASAVAKSALKSLLGKKEDSGSSSSASSFSGQITPNTMPGREQGGYVDVFRAQDGKPFTAAYDPRRRGYVSRPTVIVGEGDSGRSLEWVASNDAVANPTIRPVIDLIDRAQRSGQVRTVDMSRIIRSRLAGFDNGGFIATAPTQAAAPSLPISPDPVQLQLLRLLQELNANGVKASTYIGLTELQAEMDKMNTDNQRFTRS